jgi:hypothetical protein
MSRVFYPVRSAEFSSCSSVTTSDSAPWAAAWAAPPPAAPAPSPPACAPAGEGPERGGGLGPSQRRGSQTFNTEAMMQARAGRRRAPADARFRARPLANGRAPRRLRMLVRVCMRARASVRAFAVSPLALARETRARRPPQVLREEVRRGCQRGSERGAMRELVLAERIGQGGARLLGGRE